MHTDSILLWEVVVDALTCAAGRANDTGVERNVEVSFAMKPKAPGVPFPREAKRLWVKM